jgi:hypothetical protein
MTITSQGQSSVGPSRSSPHSRQCHPPGTFRPSWVGLVSDVGRSGPVLQHQRAHHLEPRDGGLGASTGGLAPEHVHSVGRTVRPGPTVRADQQTQANFS